MIPVPCVAVEGQTIVRVFWTDHAFAYGDLQVPAGWGSRWNDKIAAKNCPKWKFVPLADYKPTEYDDDTHERTPESEWVKEGGQYHVGYRVRA